jgi:excisionase family DNA binding protein
MTTHTASPTSHRPVELVSDSHSHPTADPARGTRLLIADDVAGLLGVSPAFVYALVRRGDLPAVRVGGRYVRFRSQAVEEWIAAHETSRGLGARR